MKKVLPGNTLLAWMLLLCCISAVPTAAPAQVATQGQSLQKTDEAGEIRKVFSQIRALIYQNRRNEALQVASEALTKFPESAPIWTMKGRIHQTFREFEKAHADLIHAVELDPSFADAWQLKGVVEFQMTRPADSVDSFDKYLELRPAEAPYHWQRGISLYYAADFEEGALQFEIHKSVNPADVENVFWHYLCNAGMKGATKAAENIIPLQPGDGRIPMREIHGLITGKNTTMDVIDAAVKGSGGNGIQEKNNRFYAHLYLGLYFESTGDQVKSLEHMQKAAETYSQTHFMGDVAKVHYRLRQDANGARDRQKPQQSPESDNNSEQ